MSHLTSWMSKGHLNNETLVDAADYIWNVKRTKYDNKILKYQCSVCEAFALPLQYEAKKWHII